MKNNFFLTLFLVALFPFISKAQAPVANKDTITGINYNYCGKIKYVLKNDLNLTGSDTLTIVSGPHIGASTATVQIDNSILYNPVGSVFDIGKVDSVVYKVSNANGSSTSVLYIIIGNTCFLHPEAKPDTVYMCSGDTKVFNVTRNDLSYTGSTILTDILAPASKGSVTKLNDSMYSYTAFVSASGKDSFLYKAYDDPAGNNSSARVYIMFNACNHPPFIVDTVAGKNDGKGHSVVVDTTYEDVPKTRIFTIADADGDTGKITAVYGNKNTTITFTDNGITVTPKPNFVGNDTFYIITCDKRGYCDTTMEIFTVLPVQDKPVAVNDIVSNPDKTTISITPLTNDSDPDGEPLTVVSVSPTAQGATVTVSADGKSVNYIPNPNAAGVDSFTYRVTDGKDTVSAKIYVYNPASPKNDNATANPDAPVVINVLNNDVVTPNSQVKPGALAPSHGTITVNPDGTISYTPTSGYYGPDTFSYYVCDTSVNPDVCKEAFVYISASALGTFPKGISPDGDGNNDEFVIPGIGMYPESVLTVFNRWGDIVWQNAEKGYKNNFRGANNDGESLPDGTYYYILNFNSEGMKNKASYLMIHR